MLSKCPSCQRAIEVPPAAVGKSVRCTGCQAIFVITELPTESPPTPAPPSPPPPPAPPKAKPQPKEEVKPKKKRRTDAELEKVTASKPPVTATKKPTPSCPAPAATNPLDFAPATGPASLDFGGQKPGVKNVSAELRLKRAVSWLYFGVGLAFFDSLVMTIVALVVSAGHFGAFAIGAGIATTVLALGILMLLGARAISDQRGRGLGIAAALSCVFSALLVLAFLGAEGIFALGRLHRSDIPTIGGFLCLQLIFAFLFLLVGVVAMFSTFGRGVAEVFQNAAESQRRNAEQGAQLTRESMRGYAIRTVLWLLLLSFWLATTFSLAAARLLYVAWPHVPPVVWIVIGVLATIYAIPIFILLLAAVMAFLLRAPIITNIGGIMSAIIAAFSYLGFLYVLFAIWALFFVGVLDLVAPTEQARIIVSILVISNAVLLLAQILLGLMTFLSAMRTARLMRRFLKNTMDVPEIAK